MRSDRTIVYATIVIVVVAAALLFVFGGAGH